MQEAARPDLCGAALEALPLISRVIFWLLRRSNPFSCAGVRSVARPRKVPDFHAGLLYGLLGVRAADGGH